MKRKDRGEWLIKNIVGPYQEGLGVERKDRLRREGRSKQKNGMIRKDELQRREGRRIIMRHHKNARSYGNRCEKDMQFRCRKGGGTLGKEEKKMGRGGSNAKT